MSQRRQLYPLVSVDVALFCVEDNQLKVLLVKRATEPEQHRWALPGGVLQPENDASLLDAARRVLDEKISVKVRHLAQVMAFSGATRDPRGWSIGMLFYALLPRDQLNAVERHKVEQLEWANAEAPGHRLAFDHAEQLRAAVAAVRQRVESDQLPLHLLPAEFTLTELQRTCEAILRKPFDKSAFRRRFKENPGLESTGRRTEGGRQRPAEIFRASSSFSRE